MHLKKGCEKLNKILEIFKQKKPADNRPISKMSVAISQWSDLYENKSFTDSESKSLNLAAAICSELARLATIELKSEVFGSDRADFINTHYQRTIDVQNVKIVSL